LKADITDLGVLRPDPQTGELMLVSRHPGVSTDDILRSTGWALKVAAELNETPSPTMAELVTLRDFESRGSKAA
jgi:glutaconate CoA-transferase subunit B